MGGDDQKPIGATGEGGHHIHPGEALEGEFVHGGPGEAGFPELGRDELSGGLISGRPEGMGSERVQGGARLRHGRRIEGRGKQKGQGSQEETIIGAALGGGVPRSGSRGAAAPRAGLRSRGSVLS